VFILTPLDQGVENFNCIVVRILILILPSQSIVDFVVAPVSWCERNSDRPDQILDQPGFNHTATSSGRWTVLEPPICDSLYRHSFYNLYLLSLQQHTRHHLFSDIRIFLGLTRRVLRLAILSSSPAISAVHHGAVTIASTSQLSSQREEQCFDSRSKQKHKSDENNRDEAAGSQGLCN
jgi:hypothetical protein